MNRITVQTGNTVIEEIWEDRRPNNCHITLRFNGKIMFQKTSAHQMDSNELLSYKEEIIKFILNGRGGKNDSNK